MAVYRVSFWKWQRRGAMLDVEANDTCGAVKAAERAEPAYKGWLDSADPFDFKGKRIQVVKLGNEKEKA